jgi:hypothetical protein
MMNIVMVGGHTRNIGKTSVIEGIIAGLPEIQWTAVKITQFGHGVCSVNAEPCDCVVAEHQFSISQERETDSGTDTSRFVAAGARRALWMRIRQGELVDGLAALRREIERDQFVIVESNSLRRFIEPTIYLQVIDPANSDFKLSAQQFFDLADAYLIVEGRDGESPTPLAGEHAALLAREVQKGKACFVVSAKERFINQLVIDFVRTKLRG